MTPAAVLRSAELVVFTVLALVALRQWRVRRDVPSRELAVTFGVLSGVLVVARLVPSGGDDVGTQLVGRVLLVGLVLFPYLLQRFAAAFEALPRWTTRAGTALVAVTVLATVTLPPFPERGEPRALWFDGYVVLVLVEWAFLSFAVSWRLWVAGAGLPRVARLRMRTLGLGAAVLVVGLVGRVAPGTDAAWWTAGSGVLALSSCALFLVGFAPPSWLVRTWRGESEAVQQLLVGLVAETDDEQVVSSLLPRLLELVGARGAALVDDGGRVVATAGQVPDGLPGQLAVAAPARRLARDVELLSTGHVRVRLDDGALHVWTGPYAPYFGRAELGLLASFGALVQLSLQRTASYAREREATLALEEAQAIAGIGSWRWVVGSNEPQWSKQMHRLYGLPLDASLEGRGYLSIVHPDDRAWLDAEIARAVAHGHDVTTEYRILRHGRDLRWVQSRMHVEQGADGTVAVLYGTCQDITERRSLEHELQHQARHDPLTGLPNRRMLVELLAATVERTRDRGTAVLFLDVDRFKIVNDSLGHDAGDQVLLAVAERLSTAVRVGDVVGRFGGDEFVVVGQVEDEDAALALADRLHAATTAPVTVGGTDLVVTVSTGIALCLDGRTPAGALVRDADAAMYAAKRAGGDRAVLFADAMRAAAVDRLEVEVDMRRALAEDQLRVHYQPVFDTATGALVGAEALVRWQHPTRGLLGPADFVGVAEETGLIVDLGREVLRQACRQLRTWQDSHPHLRRMWMSVNLSALQVFGTGLTSEVVSAVHTAGIAPECLTLEITESVLMTDVEDALAVLGALRVLGVRLSVDDFGTGYSSLAYLTRLPVSSLKVDKSFLSRLDVDPHALAVVQGVAALAQALGLEIVAEGVEDEAQLATVRRLGVGMAQGFHLGRPVAADAWDRYLAPPADVMVQDVPLAEVPALEVPAPRSSSTAIVA